MLNNNDREQGEGAELYSLAGLMHKLGQGWQIRQPVYIMSEPKHRERIVFRFALWRDGRPQVVAVPDGPDVRQFIADRHLRQEPL